MFDKLKKVGMTAKDKLSNLNTKGKFIAASCAVPFAALVPSVSAFAAEDPDVTTNTVSGVFSGVGSVVTDVVSPVLTFCSSNVICLAFLSVTFAKLGARLVGRIISAFGRGR